MTSKQLAKTIPFNEEPPALVSCALTAKCTSDHQIGRVMVSQSDLADEVMEITATATSEHMALGNNW